MLIICHHNWGTDKCQYATHYLYKSLPMFTFLKSSLLQNSEEIAVSSGRPCWGLLQKIVELLNLQTLIVRQSKLTISRIPDMTGRA